MLTCTADAASLGLIGSAKFVLGLGEGQKLEWHYAKSKKCTPFYMSVAAALFLAARFDAPGITFKPAPDAVGGASQNAGAVPWLVDLLRRGEFDCGQLLTAAAGEDLTDLDHGISETIKEVFPYEEFKAAV